LTPGAACRCHNVRAPTVLGYVSQLCPPPRNIPVAEAWAATKVLRYPGSGISAATAAELHTFGCPCLTSVSAMCFAALGRTATDGKIQWKELVNVLNREAGEKLAFVASVRAKP
jgi:hypothetical protein